MEKQIAKFNKNATEEVIVRLSNYKGLDLVDIRVYVKPITSKEELKATRKGICLRVEHIPVLLKALKEAEKTMKEIKDLRSGKNNQN